MKQEPFYGEKPIVVNRPEQNEITKEMCEKCARYHGQCSLDYYESCDFIPKKK